MSILDEIAPPYIGEDRIAVTLAPKMVPAAFQPFTVLVDYSACDQDGGIVLPLEILLRAPSPGNSLIRRVTTTAPETLLFTPREGGLHLVLVRELYHNRWWGRIRVSVAGEGLRTASAL